MHCNVGINKIFLYKFKSYCPRLLCLDVILYKVVAYVVPT